MFEYTFKGSCRRNVSYLLLGFWPCLTHFLPVESNLSAFSCQPLNLWCSAAFGSSACVCLHLALAQTTLVKLPKGLDTVRAVLGSSYGVCLQADLCWLTVLAVLGCLRASTLQLLVVAFLSLCLYFRDSGARQQPQVPLFQASMLTCDQVCFSADIQPDNIHILGCSGRLDSDGGDGLESDRSCRSFLTEPRWKDWVWNCSWVWNRAVNVLFFF